MAIQVKNKKALIIGFSFLMQDPPSIQTVVELLGANYNVTVIQGTEKGDKYPICHKNLAIVNYDKLLFLLPFKNSKLNILLKYFLFIIISVFYTKFKRFDLIVSIMLHPIAILSGTKAFKVACIYDIPPIESSGKISNIFYKRALKNLNTWQLVWASDRFKGEIIKNLALLEKNPVICHNCPPLNYFEGISKHESRVWLEKILLNKGLRINSKTKIILRAGAVGKYGGIEETIDVLKRMTDNVIFLLMGRPHQDYYQHLISLIDMKEMSHKVYVWNLPSDEEWKKILLASDLGHLIHLRPNDDEISATAFDQNSSMSNNRLFQYMAAGISIISYQDDRMSDLYKEVDCFYIVDPNNLNASIETAFTFYLLDEDRSKLKGKNGKEAFEKKYNWNYQFSKILHKIKT